MKIISKIICALVFLSSTAASLQPFPVSAAPADYQPQSTDVYSRARILSISTVTSTNASESQTEKNNQPALTAKLKIISGPEKDKQITAQYEPKIAGPLQAGETVVVDKPDSQASFYYIVDPYRINRLVLFILLFFAVAIYFGRRRGLFAIVGLVISVLIIFYYLVPRIIAGGSPLSTSLVAALLITIISLFVAHGMSRRTTIAFVSTLLSLAMAIVIDLALVYTTKLTGGGSEEAAYLQFGNSPVNLQGILLAGILIGVLGILDDITTAQAACVEEIHSANPALPFKELYRRGLSVGREHIASLINTLVLAYVGVSFPTILLMVSSKGGSLWVVMNNSFMAEEIVRTLVGSLVLVVAVPLTTFLAAYFYSHWPIRRSTQTVG